MAKKDVLSRVRRDLEAGHPDLATQRLRTLVSMAPDDLEAYRILAEIYRRTGNPVEAGRWSFLLDSATDEEIAAFERAHPTPWIRIRLIRWTGDPDTLASEAGRRRWQALVDEVTRSGEIGPADEWSRQFQAVEPSRRPWLTALTVVLAIALVGLGAFGVLQLVERLSD